MAAPETFPYSDPNTGEHSAFGGLEAQKPEPAVHDSTIEQTTSRERWSLKRVGNKLFELSMRAIYGDLRHLADSYAHVSFNNSPAETQTPAIQATVRQPEVNPSIQPESHQYRIPRQRQPGTIDQNGVLHL
ncbi:MAG TPA: hypothetical protein VM581_02510 [Magnetospirillaceae bacterium]|nr:hypothetical protein [Magnetospirillaceae bacterium]